MNLKIINDCAGTDLGLPTAGTDPNRRYNKIFPFTFVHYSDIIREV